jgi:hypothetical protein
MSATSRAARPTSADYDGGRFSSGLITARSTSVAQRHALAVDVDDLEGADFVGA